jgi:hypothetical protein
MSATSTSQPDASFKAEFEAARQSAFDSMQSARRHIVDGVGADIVARLALAPIWTTDVLERSGLAPGDTLDLLVEAGVASRSGERFVVPDDNAREMVAGVLRSGPDAVTEHLGVVSEGVNRARTAGAEVPATLDRFCTLAAGGASATLVASRLIEQVEASSDVAEAVNWIDAAARLELGLGRPVLGARLQAGRLVAHRRRDSEIAAFLNGYFHRPALESELLTLRDGGGEPWARHVRGDGGTGKTMLVRWLEAGFPSDGSAGSVVRVDFDYLHPNYPGTEPGLLVLLLAAELRFFATSEAATRFDRLDAIVADWHERIDEAERTRPGEVAAIRAGRQDLVQGAFADAIRALPAPVVVILDTTEELEKAAGGTANVHATIAMLTRLHDAVPPVRVVLSGRRDLPLPPGVEELELVGFNRAEASRFVTWIGVEGKRAAAVVSRVAADAAPGNLSPFDLSLLARWAHDDPSLSATAIRAIDDDRYVEHRILGRLGATELEAVLPVIVALGRFDVATLGAVTGTDGESLDHLGAAISRQEWIGVESGSVLVVDTHLRDRLAGYLERNRRVAWEEARLRAAAHLRAHCETAPRSAVTAEHVAGAIRLTEPSDGVDLADWWARIEERARAEAAFGWLLGITRLLLGTGGGVGDADALFAAVTASYVACLAHEEPDPVGNHRQLWQKVYDRAEPGTRLAARGAAHLEDDVRPALEQWADELDEALAASFIAGLEHLLASKGGLSATAQRLHSATLERELSPELQATAALLVGRAYAVDGDRAASRRWFAKAVDLVENAVGGQDGNEWMDWSVDDVGARIRLWAAATWWPELGSPGEASRWLDVAGTVTNVDQDREASLAGISWLATGRSYRHRVPEVAGSFPSRVVVHLDTPPLVVPRALAKARDGDVDEAVADLEAWAAERPAGEEYLAVERARMLLVRRYRLRDVGEGLTTGLADSLADADIALLTDLDAFDGEKVSIPPWQRDAYQPHAHIVHGWWRAVRASDPSALANAIHWESPARIGPRSKANEVHRVLDAVEFARLAGRRRVRRVPDVAAWVAAHQHEPEAALRLTLRAAALGEGDRVDVTADRLAKQIGRNLAAEIALDEGDSLALRLPGRAGMLLDLAARWFATARDGGGELRARAAAALAAQAAGSEVAKDAGAALARVYRRVADRFGLPTWEELARLSLERVDDTPRGWQPWTIRCAIATAATADGIHGDLVEVLRGRSAAVREDGQLLLPAELVGPWASAARATESARRWWDVDHQTSAKPVVLKIDGLGTGRTTRILRSGTVRVLRLDRDEAVDVVASAELPLSRAGYRDLRNLLSDLDPSTAVELYHSADVGAVSWEATVADAVPGGLLTRAMWRRVQRPQRGRPPSTGEHWPVLAIASDPSLTIPWQGAQRIGTLTPESVTRPRVVHLVGRGAEARSGVGFTLDPVRGPGMPNRHDPTAPELLKRFIEPDLVIVQGFPDDEPELDTWSREQAAYLRQIGTDFALAGVPAVVVVPGQGMTSWRATLDALTTTLTLAKTNRLSPAALVATVRAVRQAVLDTGPEVRGPEDALGVCLFMSDNLTG